MPGGLFPDMLSQIPDAWPSFGSSIAFSLFVQLIPCGARDLCTNKESAYHTIWFGRFVACCCLVIIMAHSAFASMNMNVPSFALPTIDPDNPLNAMFLQQAEAHARRNPNDQFAQAMYQHWYRTLLQIEQALSARGHWPADGPRHAGTADGVSASPGRAVLLCRGPDATDFAA